MANLTQKNIDLLKTTSQIAGGFTLLIAFTMIFSLIQLKTINPLDNPVLVSVKDQFDKDPENKAKAEQVRVIDLMARKAYFSARWQVETGSYLLLAGAIVFILCQQLLAGNEKQIPEFPGGKEEITLQQKRNRKYLFISASAISVTALVASFILRANLPDLSGNTGTASAGEVAAKAGKPLPEPDKTNWPFFRGQESRGIAGGSGYPTEWDGAAGKNIAWKTEIPKPGQSSPVIWGDKIFVTGAEGKECEIYCIDKKTGAILWTGSASSIEGEPSEFPEVDMDAGYAASSAATNGDIVCAVFANGNIVCFDMDGNRQWAKNIGVPASFYGYASSLLIYDDILLLQYDSQVKISLMGFNVKTGEQLYDTPRQGVPVWSSPVLGYFNGTPQLIINGNPAVYSFDPLTGNPLWSVESVIGDVAPSLAINSTMVYAVTDYSRLAAITPGIGGTVKWEDNMFTSDVSSPVANDELLFIATGSGDVACYNAQEGDTLWTHYFKNPFFASPVIADDKVYLLDRTGIMHVVKAQPEFQFVSEASLGERADCTPAFSDKKIYIRGKNNLYCISD
jgi:outer membrane protein assembly factor BamB